jgi:hypothetical protein
LSAEDSGRYNNGLLCAIDSHNFAGIRPIFGAIHESGAHRILKHIIPFRRIALVGSQEPIVKSRLPKRAEDLPNKTTRLVSRRTQDSIQMRDRVLSAEDSGRYSKQGKERT